ncbi:MAG: Zn-dependent hydrolase, partial [Bacteroidetes bacterium]|nr:Zn-dependent hydrolase [Bacteroidota bacterium]
LSNLIITIQGDGDYEKGSALIRQYGMINETLKSALKRVEEMDVPVELVFEQGTEMLDLK